MREFLSLWLLRTTVSLFELKHYLWVVCTLYGNQRFRRADLSCRFYNPYRKAAAFFREKGLDPYTYGETPLPILRELCKRLSLKEDDVFYDLGAGRGLAALYVACFTPCFVRAVEMVPYFTDRLKKATSSMDNIEVLQEDFFDLRFKDATVIYLYALFLTDEELLRLCRQFPKKAKVITVSEPLSALCSDYKSVDSFEGGFPFGMATIYINEAVERQ